MTERYVDAAAVDLSGAFAKREQRRPERTPADPSEMHELARQLIDALGAVQRPEQLTPLPDDDQADPPAMFAPILVADFLGRTRPVTARRALPPWFTDQDDASLRRMWLQLLYVVFCGVADHLELPHESGVLAERYGLPEDMLTALLEVAMHAMIDLPEDSVGEKGVEDMISVVHGALEEATASEDG